MTQSRSALLRLPTELRHKIYSYLLPNEVHVGLRDGNLFVSACIQHWSRYCSHPYSYHIEDQVTTARCARRLQSTWGFHWACEEHSSFSEDTEDLSLLNVCRSVRYDVYDLVARTSTVHVSDLEFIDNWARASVAVMPSSSAFTELPVSNVIRLSITLKLPLAFFRSVERLLGNDPGSSDTESAAQQASLWQRLGSTLGRFKALKKLDLWLDHNETQYWAVVNERLTLDPLLAQLKGLCDLEVTVTLPMLHPRFEKDERHYIDENPSTNARVRRVLRQKRHAVTNTRGDIRIVKENDFPFMYEVYEQRYDMSHDEIVSREREEWREGRDMEKVSMVAFIY